MGTWDEGLYDGDQPLDTIAELIQSVSLEQDAAHLAAGLGLRLWFQALDLEVDHRRLLARHADWVRSLPAPTRAALEEIAADPQAADGAPGARPKEIEAIVGRYCNGPRRTELLTFPGAALVIAELAATCRARLGRALRLAEDLYELSGDLAALGVLVELGELAPPTPPEELFAWEAAYDAVDRRTDHERDFWEAYGARVKQAFARLRAAGPLA